MSEPLDRTTAMGPMPTRRRMASVLVGIIVVVALALPVLAADPSASPDASHGPRATLAPRVDPTAAPAAVPSESPERGKPDKPGKPDKADKTPGVPITLRGTVASATDAKGRPSFSMTSGGKTYELEAGPAWFWGANSPLAKYVGKTVTIVGETHVGGTEVDVETVDGTAIRAPGKPPWAGGWKVQGEKHPGWSQEKADRFKAKFGDCFPPGQCKKTTQVAGPSIPRGD